MQFVGRVESQFLATLLPCAVVPILLFFLSWTFVARRMAERTGGTGGMMSIGQSKAKVYVEAT